MKDEGGVMKSQVFVFDDAPERGAMHVGKHTARKSYGIFYERDGRAGPLAYFVSKEAMELFIYWLTGDTPDGEADE